MPSEKQVEANRRNAALSTGPKTEEGKEKVRTNALKHGLRAETLEVLSHEDPVAYQARMDFWFEHYQPTSPAEQQLVRHLANLSWKIERIDRYETAFLSQRIVEAINACEGDYPPDLADAAAIASFDPSMDGERLRRYQFAMNREFVRTLETLTKLRTQEAKAKKEAAIDTNKANSAAPNKANLEIARHENRAESRIVAAPNKANSASTVRPSQHSASIPDLFAGVPAPNKANFAQNSSRSLGNRPLDLLGDDRPNKANVTPLSRISCLTR